MIIKKLQITKGSRQAVPLRRPPAPPCAPLRPIMRARIDSARVNVHRDGAHVPAIVPAADITRYWFLPSCAIPWPVNKCHVTQHTRDMSLVIGEFVYGAVGAVLKSRATEQPIWTTCRVRGQTWSARRCFGFVKCSAARTSCSPSRIGDPPVLTSRGGS